MKKHKKFRFVNNNFLFFSKLILLPSPTLWFGAIFFKGRIAARGEMVQPAPQRALK
jgi:hypothetical protein